MWKLKPKTILARLLVNITIIYSAFQNPQLMEKICGPFTLPIAHKIDLLPIIFIMELIRIFYQVFSSNLNKIGLKISHQKVCNFLTIKYLIVLLFKIFLIFDEDHRKKFYLHTFLQEGAILGSAIIFDCFNQQKIKEVGQLLIIQGLHRLALIYVLTQTFCPNLILYYSITNLIIFLLSQIQAQAKFGINKSLYVKHDIYRFLVVSLGFFAMTSLTQISSYGLKMLIVFGCSFIFHYGSISDYSQNKFLKASWKLFLIACIFSIIEIICALFDW